MRTAIVAALARLSRARVRRHGGRSRRRSHYRRAPSRSRTPPRVCSGTGPLMAKIDVEQSGKRSAASPASCSTSRRRRPSPTSSVSRAASRPWKDPKTQEWVKKPLYDGTIFHRVIPEFMIQGGDPKGNGTGEPGYEFGDEIVDRAADGQGRHPGHGQSRAGTNGSQFFITEKATPWLTASTPSSGSARRSISRSRSRACPRGARNLPMEPVTIKKITIARGATKTAKKRKRRRTTRVMRQSTA